MKKAVKKTAKKAKKKTKKARKKAAPKPPPATMVPPPMGSGPVTPSFGGSDS